MQNIQHISLSQLSEEIKDALAQKLQNKYWIVAEISECNVNYSGHCYIELIDKPEGSETILAKQRATIWSQTYKLISAYFKAATGLELQAGIKVLIRVSVEFHELYGMSLNVTDINPTYTIGEDEKQRREILQRLESEGIIDMNSELELPEVPQKIAVISSPKAAGYQDFMNHLHNNERGIVFYTSLFPASMQGADVEKTIVAALDKIYQYEDVFDVVVIIRGGGAKTDLRWFDNYILASNIAQFPIPVISGIGHDKDQSIVDIVSHTSLKTPTAVADFFISKAAQMLNYFQDLEEQILGVMQDFLHDEKSALEVYGKDVSSLIQNRFHKEYLRIQNFSATISEESRFIVSRNSNALEQNSVLLKNLFEKRIQKEHNKIESAKNRISYSVSAALQKEKYSLDLLKASVCNSDPKQILKKGYSLTTDLQGKVITNSLDLKNNDAIQTVFHDGIVKSVVKK